MSFWNTWRKQWVGGHMLFLGGESWTSDLRPFLLLIPHKTHGTMEMAMVHRPPPSFIHERPPSRAGAAAATQSNQSHWRTQGTNWVAARRWDEWQPFCVHLQGILAVYQYQVKYWNTIWVSIIGFVNVNERSWTSLHHCLVSSAHLSKISVVLAAHPFPNFSPSFPNFLCSRNNYLLCKVRPALVGTPKLIWLVGCAGGIITLKKFNGILEIILTMN